MLETKELLIWLIPAVLSVGFMYITLDPKEIKKWLFIVLVSLIPFVNMFSAFFSFIFVINMILMGDLD